MRRRIIKTNLTQLFRIPADYKMTPNDFRYHASLIPPLGVLRKVKAINFKKTLRKPGNRYGNELGHHNPVNTHIFKPKYFFHSEGKLVCYVSSEEVLVHTLRSLAIIVNRKYLKNDIEILVTHAQDRYGDYITSWEIGENLLIARVESVVNFLRMTWLINNENGVISRKNIINLFKELELGRLKRVDQGNLIRSLETKYLRKAGLNFRQIDRHLKLQRYKSRSPYIEFAKFEFKNVPVSVIQLPWGYSMSINMLRAIKGSGIKKLAIVGGVGYVGKDKAEIDDIFIPKKLIISNGNGVSSVAIANEIFNVLNKNYIFRKHTVSGNIFSVRPSLGKISYTEHVRGIENIHAYDMEKEGIFKVLDGSKIKIASCYYIMDFPYTNLDLGNTYYSARFLRRLFSKSDRGKYFCFERALAFLISQ